MQSVIKNRLNHKKTKKYNQSINHKSIELVHQIYVKLLQRPELEQHILGTKLLIDNHKNINLQCTLIKLHLVSSN